MPRAKAAAGKTAPNDKAQIRVKTSTKIARNSDFRSLYINNIRFGVTRFDIQIIMGENVVSFDPAHADTITEMLNVTMTPAYAKAFVLDMAKFIAAYEDQNGEIPLPGELQKLQFQQ
jgi:hypothetical protein